MTPNGVTPENQDESVPQAVLDGVDIFMRGLPQFGQGGPGQPIEALTTVNLNRTVRHPEEATIKLSRLVNKQGGVLYTWQITVEGRPWGEAMTILDNIDNKLREQYAPMMGHGDTGPG